MELVAHRIIIDVDDNDVASVKYPKYISAIVILQDLQMAVWELVDEAIVQEAQRAHQIPEEIKKLIGILKQQRKPDEN